MKSCYTMSRLFKWILQHIYLLHIDDIIAVLGKVGADEQRVGRLVTRDVIAVQDGRETCDIHAQDGQVAAGGSCGACHKGDGADGGAPVNHDDI